MKKFFKSVTLLLCIALAASMLLFVGCDKGESEALKGTMTIVMDDKNGTIKEVEADLADFTSENSAMDVIEKLTNDKAMCYTGSKGVYGVMLSSVGIVEDGTDWEGNPAKVDTYIVSQNAAEGVYLYIYTNVEADKNDSATAMTVEYKGQTLAESMNSISNMKIEDGAVIYITTIVWG